VTPDDPLFQSPMYLMLEAVRLARRRAAELHPGEPLRIQHVLSLAWLSEGPISQRELSDRLSVDPADLVSVIDMLERHGYVERHRDPDDRRRYALHITTGGRRALREHRTRREEVHESLLEALTADERSQLRTLVLKLLAHHDPRFAEPAYPQPGQTAGPVTSGNEAERS